LVAGDSNATTDIFVRDRQTGQTTRVSVASTGAQANNGSFRPALSADGRYVAFASAASNLVVGDSNAMGDIFVHDRQTGQTSRVSVASDGAQANNTSSMPVLSADGRYVAFYSWASNLVAGDTNNTPDVFVHDRQTGQTTRVSVSSTGAEGNGLSDFPAISGDGRYVAFRSAATDLVPNDTNFAGDLFVHDRLTGATSRVSVGAGGQANNGSEFPALSDDGRFLAFRSFATNLVVGDTNNQPDVFVRDLQTGGIELVSVSTAGAQADGYGTRPSISADGRYVAFESGAANLVAGDSNGAGDIFVRDRTAGTTTRVSLRTGGTQGNDWSLFPSISGDGRYVAFQSMATNLVAGDTNSSDDIFVHDRQTGETTRVSVTSAGVEGNFTSIKPWISANGGVIAFSSQATNLVPGDTNFQDDVFVHERPVAPPACPGDIDGNNAVGLSDIAILIQNWSLSVPPAPAGADLDGNHSIGLGDVAVVVQHWGEVCR
ncbi:MAG TPA: hypothetical protein VG797_02030, partial [Phycisphaerales bacterium]|nr:hypothetical protein [Phycisphaerales bacterium]